MKWSFRHELSSMCTVLAIPLAIVLAFPKSAIVFRAERNVPARPSGAAFVVLSEAREKAALAVAKASWQGGLGVRRLRANLAVGDLPDEVARPVQERRERPPETADGTVPYAPGAYVPSAAAAYPQRIAAEPNAPAAPAFSREELLKID